MWYLVNMSYLMIMNDYLFLIDDIELIDDINKDYNKSFSDITTKLFLLKCRI